MEGSEKSICVKLLQELKEKGKGFSKFQILFGALKKYATLEGLADDDFNLLADVIITSNLNAQRLVPLIGCLIPRCKVSERTFKLITTWCLSSINKLPLTVFMNIIYWILGLWEYRLIDKKVINIYYPVLFYVMLKKKSLEKHIACLVYMLTKPEDITRRDVLRLLALHKRYAKPQRHITALLSLFKSYRPELVPENISAVNIESAWKPIPENLQNMLQNARSRLEIQETENLESKSFKWSMPQVVGKKKTTKPLLPSIRYFQIGSNIFKESDTKSIFNISNIKELGESHVNIEMPCNAISLLGITAGYHLLTFADFHYQSRFCYNLYNALIQAFMLENDKYSTDEKEKLLELTAEFSRYMQRGILVVNHFLCEYLYYSTGNYELQILSLLQWMTSVSVIDLQKNVLNHIKKMFYVSSLPIKCQIIKTLRTLILNLFVIQGFEESYQEMPAPFLRENSMDNLEEIIPVVTKIAESLIISGLNIHSYNFILLSEALSFYEEINMLENRSIVNSFTLAPPALIYGSFVTRSCAMLSRICNLLLKYRDMSIKFKNQKLKVREKVNNLEIYVKDIFNALWYNKPFSERHKSYFLKNISDEVLTDLSHCNLDMQLNVNNHYAILPFKYILMKTGLTMETAEDAMSVAFYYYPNLYEFLDVFPTSTKRK